MCLCNSDRVFLQQLHTFCFNSAHTGYSTCLTSFYSPSYQRQVVSLDEEADNPAFTENWCLQGRVERRASMISYLGRPFVFIPHTAQRYGSQSQYGTSLNHYILTDKQALCSEKTRWNTFQVACFLTNDSSSAPHQIKPNHRTMDSSFLIFFSSVILTVMLMMQLEGCVIVKAT